MGESSGQVEGPQPKPSRFQFVPVPGEFTRGRWKCRDSYHPYAETLEFEKNKTKEESNPDKISVCFKLRQPKDELESSSTIQVTSVESNVQDIVEESSTSESIIITRKNGVTIVRKTSATDAADNYDKIRELSIDDFEQKTTKPPQVPPTPMNTPPATMVTDPSIGESLTPPIVTKSKTFQVHSVADSTISQPTRKTSLDVEAIQKNAEALLSETAPHSATVPAQKPHVFQVEPVLEASLPKPTPLPENTSTSEPTFQVIQTEESKNMSMDSVKNVIDAQTEQRNVDEVETPTNNVTITVSAALEKKEIFQPIREASGSVSSIEACGIPITSPPTAPHSTPYGTPKDTQRSPTFDEAFSANVPVAIAASVSTSATETLPIDNKIEQAMELVKTHLTYAVREEVDTLRNTITELEYQMREYQFECNFYRQNATPEVADQAAAFVRQQMTKFQQPTRRAASTTSVILDGAQQSSVNASNSSPHMRNLQNQIQQIKQIAPHAKPVSTTTTTATTTMTMSSNSNEQPAPSVPAPTNPPAAQ